MVAGGARRGADGSGHSRGEVGTARRDPRPVAAALDDCERGQAGFGALALVDVLGEIEPLPDLRDYRDAVRTSLALWGRAIPVLKLVLPGPCQDRPTLSAEAGRYIVTTGGTRW